MRGPEGAGVTRVTTTIQKDDGTHRWIRCQDCDHSFRTREQVFIDGNSYRGEAVSNAVLTEDDIRLIRERREEGWSYRRLASVYGINESHLAAICARRAWAHVA